jgi:hypothetical protein
MSQYPFPEAVKRLRAAAQADSETQETEYLERIFLEVLDEMVKSLTDDRGEGFSHTDLKDIEKLCFETGDRPHHLGEAERMLAQGILVADDWSIRYERRRYEDNPETYILAFGTVDEEETSPFLRELVRYYGLDRQLRGWTFRKGS